MRSDLSRGVCATIAPLTSDRRSIHRQAAMNLFFVALIGSAAAFNAPISKMANSVMTKAVPAIAAGVLAAGPAFAADMAAGEQIFSGNCAACHAGGMNVIMPEKTLQQDALEEYLEGGANVKSVVYQVTNGKNAMPAFGGRLSDEDIENVATYVITTAKNGW